MSDDQAYSEPWHGQNNLFKHFQRYLGIFRGIDAHSAIFTGVQIERRWRGFPCPFLKIEKSVLILERKVLIVFIFGLNFLFKIFIFLKST